jgi:hypothetical protein
MSYRLLNDGRSRSPVFFSDVSAIAATRFLAERREAEMPVPTDDQVKRATRLIADNPTVRGRFNSPLGIVQLALELPLSKRERRLNRLSKDDGGMALELEPRRVRYGDKREVQAPTERVEQFLEANPTITLPDAVETICNMGGYTTASLPAVLARVERFSNSRAPRPAGHIRDKALMLDAIAQASNLIADRDAAKEEEPAS